MHCIEQLLKRILICNAGIHWRNLVGDTGDVPPLFSEGVDIICHEPPHFFFRFFIWRGFKNNSDVCHLLYEDLFMLDGRPHVAKLLLK